MTGELFHDAPKVVNALKTRTKTYIGEGITQFQEQLEVLDAFLLNVLKSGGPNSFLKQRKKWSLLMQAWLAGCAMLSDSLRCCLMY